MSHVEGDSRRLPDWMAGLPDNIPLAEVSMPGTHNSASFAVGGDTAGRIAMAVVKASRCQSWDLGTQLAMGVRFLDLRVHPDGQLCHGPVLCGGLTLGGIFGICSAFLRAHPREVLLARVKDQGASAASARGVEALIRHLAESASHALYLQMRLPVVGEVRGRIVLLCDWAGGQLGIRWGSSAMLLQDEYWHKSGASKWRAVRRHLGFAAPSPDRLQVHFTSATSLPRKTPITIARSVNRRLSDHLRCAPGLRYLGIVVMDFPSPSLCELIVQRNWRCLDPCRSTACLTASSVEVREWIDDLQCELAAAAVRADAAVALAQPEDLLSRTQWLARVFVKLLVDRGKAELCEPSLVEPAASPRRPLPAGVVRPGSSQEEVFAGTAAEKQSERDLSSEMLRRADVSSPRPRYGHMLCRLGSRLGWRGGGQRRRQPQNCLSLSAPKNTISIPGLGPGDDWIDDLRCELAAAASRADGAELARRPEEELRERAQWLARVLVRLLVCLAESSLAEASLAVASLGKHGDPPFTARNAFSGGSDGSAADDTGAESCVSEPSPKSRRAKAADLPAPPPKRGVLRRLVACRRVSLIGASSSHG